MTLRNKTYQVLEFSARGRRGLSLYVNVFLVSVIIINCIAIILHTIPEFRHNRLYEAIFQDFEIFSVIVFTIEYLLRVWSCVENPRYPSGWRGRAKYIFSFWGIVDFLGIFPFYFTLLTSDFGFVRILRVFRLFRLFRVTRYSHALQIIQNVLTETKEELLICLSFIIFTLLISSSTMYYLEHNAQPDKFSSIPASLWWGVITMTTTGYGDMYPVTPAGKIFGGLVLILGIALFALPTGIIASGFMEQIRRSKERHYTRCPHCEELIDLRRLPHVHKPDKPT
ncbi:MAG: ion transporter [Spirosomaceae bacterium]|jgi:voltage-gated potassium channel|nr:ion transporter [Spirosomataceae bacterium]